MSDYSFDGNSEPSPAQPRLDLARDASVARATSRAPRAKSHELDDREVHLIDHIKVLYKRRWTAITAFLLVFVSATVHTLTATSIFEAKIRLLIETENPNVVSFKAVVDEDQTKQDYYQTQYNILQSRALARRTIEELKLWNTPPFGGSSNQRVSVTASVAAALSYVVQAFRSASAEKVAANSIPDADGTMAQSRAIDRFLSNLTISPIRNSRLVDVKYDLPDGALAARIANSLGKNYIEQNLEYKFTASKDANDWLAQRLAEQRKAVEEAEVKLQRYREQNDAISLQDRENIVVQKLTELNAAVTQAKTDRFQKEAAYNQLQALRGNTAALDTFPAILGNTFIQQQKAELANLQSQYAQLGEKLGPNHPDMLKLRSAIQVTQAKLDGETGKVVQAVKNEYLAAVAKENSLTAALNAQKGEALAMNRKGIDYSVLDRDVQSSRQVYDSLLQRAKETGVSTELKASNIRVVDPAELPRSPAYPNKSTNLLRGFLSAAIFAVGVVFLFEYMDNRIKTPHEIQVHLSVPFLGIVPALFDRKAKSPLINNGVPANFLEAFRAVRTNVVFSSADEGGKTITVTSTGPSEGKTLVCTNLAMALALAGQRVLLVDADMRKPRVHEVLGVPQEPGLSNVLVGTAKASGAVRTTTVAGLWVLPAGVLPPNPPELLGSKRFSDFLTSLAGHFDWVFVDTPPVMAVTDSCVTAHRTQGTIFVVGAEMTSRQAAKRALNQLAQSKAKLAGVILNRVDLKHHAYYYSQYYRQEYGEYYTRTA